MGVKLFMALEGGGLEVYQTSTIINTPNIYYFICEATGLFLITGDISL